MTNFMVSIRDVFKILNNTAICTELNSRSKI